MDTHIEPNNSLPGGFPEAIMWWKKKIPSRDCGNGHPLLSTWDSCPLCEDLRQLAHNQQPLKQRAINTDPKPLKAESDTILIQSPHRRDAQLALNKGYVVGWIVALNGEHIGEDFKLHSGRNVIGTHADCDVVLSDRQISRRHCVIRFEGRQFQLLDLDSSNGTQVNDESVQRRELFDNDVLTLGDIRFKFKSLS